MLLIFSDLFLVGSLTGLVLAEVLGCCFALTEVLGCCFGLTGVSGCCFALTGVSRCWFPPMGCFEVLVAFTLAPFWIFDIFCIFCLFVIFMLLELAELFVFGGLVVVHESLVLIFISWACHKLYLIS